MTSGAFGGISGWERRAFLRTLLAIAALLVLVDSVNVLSVLHDRADLGRPVALWKPMVWEYTSGLCALAFSPIAFLAVRFSPPDRGRWPRFILVHLLASLVYSALHVGGMFGLRALIYAGVGSHYGGELASFPYEYRKDLLFYVIVAAAFWLALRLSQPPAPVAAQAQGETRPSLDITDGARLIRVAVADIVSIASAGNYVEFTLTDGRRPLMRATLSRLEAQLAGHGLVRTHRSWLVNAAKVTALEAAGSGDFTVELEGGSRAPLSRRFPQALARLRTAG